MQGLPPDSPDDYAKNTPIALLVNRGNAPPGLALNVHGLGGRECSNRTKDSIMLDTALLIASALSLAMMVLFSELP